MWSECSFNAHSVPSVDTPIVYESALHIHSNVNLEMGFVHDIRPYTINDNGVKIYMYVCLSQ